MLASIARPMKVRLPCGLSSRLHIIGDSVSATKPETITAPASVSANSTNSLPIRPGVNATGA